MALDRLVLLGYPFQGGCWDDRNVQIRIIEDAKNYAFKLRNKRLVDRSHINLLKKQGITTNIF